jgi:hypothetical protein
MRTQVKPHKRLLAHISEAWQLVRMERERQNAEFEKAGLPINLGVGWPYCDEDKLSPQVSKKMGGEEKSRRELTRRLRAFPYPYPHGSKSGETFHAYMKKLNLLDVLRNPPLLSTIRFVWFHNRSYELEIETYKARKSHYGYSRKFHREMLLELSHNLEKLDKIVQTKRYEGKQAPRSWVADHRSAILRLLLREACVCYPQLRKWFVPVSKLGPSRFRMDIQLALLHTIEAALAKRGIRGKLKAGKKKRGMQQRGSRRRKHEVPRVAYQITALICSAQNCVATKKLNPTPDAVRTNVRNVEKRNDTESEKESLLLIGGEI